MEDKTIIKDNIEERIETLERRLEGLTKLINNIFQDEIDKLNQSEILTNKQEVEGTSKLIIDRTHQPYIFIARRRDNDRVTENMIFIDNVTRDNFFRDCKKQETINNDKLKWSIAEGSPDYEKWRKLFV